MRHIVFNKHSKRIDISDLKTKNYNLILSHFKLNTYLYIILFAVFKQKVIQRTFRKMTCNPYFRKMHWTEKTFEKTVHISQ